ncbi:MAG TPA: serine hydrolase [Gemmatimonadaceae bacterium]
MTKRIMSLVALCLAFTAAGAQQPPQSRPELVRQIDSIANDYVTSGPTASAAVAVVRGRDTIVMRGYGYADIAAKRRAGPTTVYEIGSITKQFTSSAIMRLVEQGKINLDDDLSKYVPNFPLHGRHVTIGELLNHTSGIHNYTAEPAWQKHWAEDLTTDSIVGFVKQDTLDFAPGTKWSYSNTGYVLLGIVVEKASGKPYATYLDEQFFKPLRLRQTRYCPSHAPDTTFATGYSIKAGQLVPSTYLSMTHPFSAGALCSTARDFLVWQRALNNSGRVVSARSYALMTTPDTLANGTRLTYGFGLGVSQLGSHRMISHGGGINGFTTAQLWVPDDTLSVIMFTNTDGRAPDGAAVNIARAVLGLPFVQPRRAPPAVALDPALRDQVVGTYEFKAPSGGTFTIHIYVEGERLMSKADGPGQGAFPLVYYGNNTFGAGFDPSMRLAFVIENGRATRASLTQGGGTMEGTRQP